MHQSTWFARRCLHLPLFVLRLLHFFIRIQERKVFSRCPRNLGCKGKSDSFVSRKNKRERHWRWSTTCMMMIEMREERKRKTEGRVRCDRTWGRWWGKNRRKERNSSHHRLKQQLQQQTHHHHPCPDDLPPPSSSSNVSLFPSHWSMKNRQAGGRWLLPVFLPSILDWFSHLLHHHLQEKHWWWWSWSRDVQEVLLIRFSFFPWRW